jgi:hypothetical protein
MLSVAPKVQPLVSDNPLHASIKQGDTNGSRSEGPPTVSSTSRSRRLWFIILFAVVVFATTILTVVSLTKNDDSDSHDGTVISPPPGRSSLSRCPKNQLCQLMYDDELAPRRRLAGPTIPQTLPSEVSDKASVVGRSYDESDWESSPVAIGTGVPRLIFGCSNDACHVDIPASLPGSFYLVVRQRGRLTTSKERVARLLNQATFGATKQEIESFPSSPHAWVEQQLAETATSHRAYYRHRVNPPTDLVSPAGRPRKYCEEGSRWDTWAIQVSDVGKQISFVSNTSTLVIDSIRVTEVNDAINFAIVFEDADGNDNNVYTICEWFGYYADFATDCDDFDERRTIYNLPIVLSSPPPADNVLELLNEKSGFVSVAENSKLLHLDPNEPIVCDIAKGIMFAKVDSQYYRHTSRLVLLENTLASPDVTSADDDGPSVCTNVEKSFVNMDSCTIHRGNACEALRPSSITFALNEDSLKDFYTFTASYVYVVNGLRLDQDSIAHSPCLGTASRWIKTDVSECVTGTKSIDQETITTLTSLLASSQDANPTIRDIRVPNGARCQPTKESVGVKLIVGGNCWEHVHSDLHNVFDFSFWAQENAHPGNSVAAAGGRRNPIKKIAEDNNATLNFPSHHEMLRWVQNNEKLTYIGRFNDKADFSSLPTNLQTEAMATHLGAPNSTQTFGEWCGSPNEVANQPELGHRHMMGLSTYDDLYENGLLDSKSNDYFAKTSPWTMIAMYGKDQLRQRVAWALSQVLVVSSVQLVDFQTEAFHHYYDIFVRHAFGNYRDVLKEVSFSPMMGSFLSYIDSTSFQYKDLEIFPDENFAREIMQLFTIGLFKLNMDGTVVHNADGVPVESYTNDDISK